MVRSNRWWIAAALPLAALLVGTGPASAGDDEEFAQYRARRDSITPGHGNSVSHNIAVQTVNPWPPNVNNSRIDVDGERLLLGIRRYQANRSIPPAGIATQSIISVGKPSGSGGQ